VERDRDGMMLWILELEILAHGRLSRLFPPIKTTAMSLKYFRVTINYKSNALPLINCVSVMNNSCSSSCSPYFSFFLIAAVSYSLLFISAIYPQR
jgi:hypothetical protein